MRSKWTTEEKAECRIDANMDFSMMPNYNRWFLFDKATHQRRWSALCFYTFLLLTTTLLSCMPQCVLGQSYDPSSVGRPRSVKCYDEESRNPQKCFPEFINAAYKADVSVTNTCGMHGPSVFCYQTTATGAPTVCDYCNNNDSRKAHPAALLTDLSDRGGSTTWWQSETLAQHVERDEVNITISFHKTFDITYVRILFKSPRPSSFAILKRTCETCPWEPYQFYSKSCQAVYGLPDMFLQGEDIIIDDALESQAFCTSGDSDISPLTGGTIAFSTLELRQGAIRFDENEPLQKWVTATDIMISLKKLNTFGDQIFSDIETAQTYFYAISDIAVGGRCKCNGHANDCTKSSGFGVDERWVCVCRHETEGPDCNKCKEFFQDRPWKRATLDDANICAKCNCNGNSDRCYFDEELYFLSGNKSGGHCTNCQHNTDGPHCENCKPEHYRPLQENRCLPCLCDRVGAHNAQCSNDGQCRCKPGVGGLKCQACLPNYYGFSPLGCTPCGCEPAGSVDNSPTCDQTGGQCACKANVEGQNCDKCKPGYFDLSTRNQFGCLKCFCNGHSVLCQSDEEYVRSERYSRFLSDSDGWTAEYEDGRKYPFDVNGGRMRVVAPDSGGAVYFVAPKEFLGEPGLGLRTSYGQYFEFTLSVDGIGPRGTVKDIILEGYISPRQFATIALPLYAQNNPPPKKDPQLYRFRLHEQREYSWQTRLESFEFQSLLSNVTALKIHANYAHKGITYLSDVRLETAERGGAGEPATHIERCECPKGFVGEWCQDCASGFKRQVPYGGALSRCIPCQCNNHSDYCEPESGNCACRHNTAESDCSVCARGFYGNALNGTADDCKPCPCPNGSSCTQLPGSGEVVCLECPEGYAGSSCDICADGYFGDPTGRYSPDGKPVACRKCECSGNIDPNDVGNCNTTTGECLRCTRNTVGFTCERCSRGYFGSALAGNCTACRCYPPGSIATSDMFASGIIECEQTSGQCPCKSKVSGRQCDTCLPGYFNITSGNGCQRCDCDLDGATNSSCEIVSGQCNCRSGVGGRMCGSCLPYHYGTITMALSSSSSSSGVSVAGRGCKECNCDMQGSRSPQCDPLTGQCQCYERVRGRRCDMCEENHFNLFDGCPKCEACYSLVQDAVDGHRGKLDELRTMLQTINSTNIQVDNPETFRDELNRVRADVEALQVDTERVLSAGGINTGGGAGGGIEGNLVGRVNDFQRRIQNVQKTMTKINDHAVRANRTSDAAVVNMQQAEQMIDQVYRELQKLRDFINIDARRTFERAQDASNRFGQTSTQMSQIAKEARRLADEHEDRAGRITNTANTALKTSRDAVSLVDDILNEQRKNTANVLELVAVSERLEADMETSKSLAEKARMGADKAYKQALDTFTKVKALKLPKVSPKELNQTAVGIETDATRVQEVAEQMIQETAKLAESLAQESRTAQELLNEAEQTQRNTNQLLADASLAHNRSVDARQRANAIVEQARQTLKTLQEFDARRQNSRVEAERELARIDEIESAIRRAEGTAQKANDYLRSAIDTANEAKSLALRAQQVAQDAAQEAQTIRNEAAQANRDAAGLRESAQRLALNVGTVENDIQRLTEQASTEDTLVASALAGAGRASAVARNASEQARDTLKAVDQLLNKLQNVEQVDESQLAALEEQLERVSQLLESSRLPTTVKQLESARTEHQRQMGMLRLDIEDLQNEVINIEAIKDTLPNQCFKRERIEVGAEAGP